LVYYPILTFKGLTKKWINQSTLFEFYSKVLLIFSVVFNDFLYLGFFFLLANILRLILIIFLKNKENIHNIKFEIKLVKKNVLKELILKSLSYSLEKLNYILKQNGLILMIGYFFSPILVTMISTARTLFYYLPINFFDIITKPAVIEFSKLKSSASNDIRNLLKKFLFLILIFSIIYLLAANLFGKYIYDFWIDNDLINLTRITIFLISIDAILIGLVNILFVPFKAFNNFFFLSKIDFCFTVIAILIAFYLSLFFNSLNLILLIMAIFHLMLFFFLKFIIPSEIRKL
jgi:O-antigen/teichoic acid export membrane protein